MITRVNLSVCLFVCFSQPLQPLQTHYFAKKFWTFAIMHATD